MPLVSSDIDWLREFGEIGKHLIRWHRCSGSAQVLEHVYFFAANGHSLDKVAATC